MILGISSFTYGWNVGVSERMPTKPMNEVDLVNQTLEFGLKCLQIGDNLPIHTFDEIRKENLKNLIQKHSIRFELGAKKLEEDHLKTYLDLTEYFESPLLRFIIDGENYHPDIQKVVSLLKDFLPELKKRNITLGIENHDRQTAKELADIMQRVGDPNVGICLDCVNSIGAGEGLEYVAKTLAPFTVNLHVKDFKTSRLFHKMGFVIDGQIAGKGMTNLPWLLAEIGKYDRCQSAIFEQWVPPVDDAEETIQKERIWANEGIEYIKNTLK
jgi:3-oxoisoapionate decarboxylase